MYLRIVISYVKDNLIVRVTGFIPNSKQTILSKYENNQWWGFTLTLNMAIENI